MFVCFLFAFWSFVVFLLLFLFVWRKRRSPKKAISCRFDFFTLFPRKTCLLNPPFLPSPCFFVYLLSLLSKVHLFSLLFVHQPHFGKDYLGDFFCLSFFVAFSFVNVCLFL